MRVTPHILQHEFIGLKAKVVRSSNPDCVGICGKVLDETRNTFLLLHKKEEKRILKETAVFHLTLPDETVIEVDGRFLVGRPEDRAKRAVRRRW